MRFYFTGCRLDSLHSSVMMHSQGLDRQITDKLKLRCGRAKLSQWNKVSSLEKERKGKTTIAMVGKYTELADAYKSVNEALVHAGIHNKTCLLYTSDAADE